MNSFFKKNKRNICLFGCAGSWLRHDPSLFGSHRIFQCLSTELQCAGLLALRYVGSWFPEQDQTCCFARQILSHCTTREVRKGFRFRE